MDSRELIEAQIQAHHVVSLSIVRLCHGCVLRWRQSDAALAAAFTEADVANGRRSLTRA
jgi:hypothetical protein